MGPESPADEILRFEEQYRQQPESLVFARLADAYRKAGQPDRALAVLEDGLRRHPDYASGYIVRARAFRDLGRIDETLESFRRALELDGGNLVAIRELAGLAEERGDVEESLHWYRRLAQIDPTDMEVGRRVSDLESAVSSLPRETAGEPAAPPDEFSDHAVEDAGPAEPVLEGPHDWWDDSAVQRSAAPADAAEGEPREGSGEEVADGPTRREDEVVEAILNGDLPETVRVEDTWWYEEAPEDEDPEPSTDADLLTRTMADLYAEQGLHREAAQIYDELLRSSPDDPELLARLESVRGALLQDRRASDAEPLQANRGGIEVTQDVPEPFDGPVGTPWLDELRELLRAGEEKALTLPDPEPNAHPAADVPVPQADGPVVDTPGSATDGRQEDARDPDGMSRFAREWLRGLEPEA